MYIWLLFIFVTPASINFLPLSKVTCSSYFFRHWPLFLCTVKCSARLACIVQKLHCHSYFFSFHFLLLFYIFQGPTLPKVVSDTSPLVAVVFMRIFLRGIVCCLKHFVSTTTKINSHIFLQTFFCFLELKHDLIKCHQLIFAWNSKILCVRSQPYL